MATSPTRTTNITAGIISMLLAMFIFGVTNIAVKDLSSTYSIWQITFARFFFVLIPAAYMLKREGGLTALIPQRPRLLLVIGIASAYAVFILFTAFQKGQLAEVTALAYSSILFLTALSVPFLKEKVGWRRWIAVMIGFSGVLIMTGPQGSSLQVGTILAIIFALMDASVMILLRIITQVEKISTTVFYGASIAALVAGLHMIPDFQWPHSWGHFAAFAFIGIGGGIGQILLTKAYSIAPAVAVAPMIYTSLLWGALFGVLFFGETLTLNLIAGGLVVILCSIYIIYRENIERQSPPRDLLID